MPRRLRASVAALLILLVSCSGVGGPAADEEAELNPPAPNFQGVDLTGRPFQLTSFRGRTVLLIFWASWCSICSHDLQAAKLLHRRLNPRGLEVVAIAVDDTAERAREFARRNELPFTVLVDNGLAKRLYDVQGIPDSFVIDRKGRFKTVRDPEGEERTYRLSGPRDWASKEAYLSFYEVLQ